MSVIRVWLFGFDCGGGAGNYERRKRGEKGDSNRYLEWGKNEKEERRNEIATYTIHLYTQALTLN